MRHGDLRGRPSRRSSDGSSHYLGTETSRPPPRRVSRDGPCAGLSEGQVPSVTEPGPFVTDDGEGRRTLSTGRPRAPLCTVGVEQIVVRCNEIGAVTQRIERSGSAALKTPRALPPAARVLTGAGRVKALRFAPPSRCAGLDPARTGQGSSAYEEALGSWRAGQTVGGKVRKRLAWACRSRQMADRIAD